ncbi:hypothetical protein LCGC14_0363260 [marine sediment metagenome]|uniref:Uncharacterized protein n=1 Tax=marine sediment metagenome TaxID=412755 RepID=A0A0F9T7E0_9ZZZZ
MSNINICNMKLPAIIMLALLLMPATLAITKNDHFMVGIYEPGIDEYRYKSAEDNISEYRPKVSADGDVVIDWWVVMQTGTIPPDEPGYFYSKFGVETPVPGVAHEYYDYDISAWAVLGAWLRSFFTGIDEVQYPFLPPILFDRIEVDCTGDGAFESEFDYYKYPVDPSSSAVAEINDRIYNPPIAASYEPPFPQRIEVVRCFYDYKETATYKFVTNFTVRYSLSPNYWSRMMFGLSDSPNIYPGNFLTTTVAGFPLSSCGEAGTTKNLRWWPSQLAGCTFEVRYPVDVIGFGKPVGAAVSNGTNIPGSAGYGQAFVIDDDIDTVEECHNLYESSSNLLQMCLQQVAFKDMQDNNNLFGFGISIIRMTFSFLLLLFYIASISIIGFVFAVIIPGVFRKIQLIFSRATKLK